MQWIYKMKNVDVLPKTHEFMEEKLQKLDKVLFEAAHSGEVMVRKLKHSEKERMYAVQLTITIASVFLRSEERGVTIETAFDIALERLKNQATRFKDKKQQKTGRSKEQLSILGAEKELKRSKRVKIKPMYVNDAVEQMELLDHDFYMFLNIDTQRVSVAYRREDGQYGILEPDEESR